MLLNTIISIIRQEYLVQRVEEEPLKIILFISSGRNIWYRDYLVMILINNIISIIRQEYLVQRVEEEPLLKGNVQCKDYLIEALKYHLLTAEQKANFRTPRTKPRQTIGSPKVSDFEKLPLLKLLLKLIKKINFFHFIKIN